MKNGDLKVVLFNESDVIATSQYQLYVSGNYKGKDLLSSALKYYSNDVEITSGTIAGTTINGAIEKKADGFLYVGGEKIDTLAEADVFGVFFTYDSGTNTFTKVNQ